MRVEQGGPSEKDLKIRTEDDEPETREKDVEKAHDAAWEVTRAESSAEHLKSAAKYKRDDANESDRRGYAGNHVQEIHPHFRAADSARDKAKQLDKQAAEAEEKVRKLKEE